MATLTGARSILRSTLVRDAAARIAPGANAARSPVRMATDKPVSSRIFRCPAELCACLETMPPFLTVTTSVLMMSMLFGSRNSYSSLAEGIYSTTLETLYVHFFLSISWLEQD